jgi:hypothetical protein
MKKFAVFAVALALTAGAVAPAAAEAPVCLRTYWIDRTTVVNPKTILFRMKDGKVWRSDLRTPCPSLKFYGFTYQTSFEEICGGSQSIRVLTTDEVCTLGRFVPVTPQQHS